MNEHVDACIDAYLDGELSALKKQRVETHLVQCSRCRAQITQRRTLSKLLQDIPPASGLKPQEQFVSEVGLQLKERHLPMRPTGRFIWVGNPFQLCYCWRGFSSRQFPS
jgi:anti-sigma factor RsiW